MPTIEQRAASHTLFLYVDPFTIAGLEWESLDQIFRHVKNSGSSVELLLNFNSPIFARCALAALKREAPRFDSDVDDNEEIDAPLLESPSIERLNRVVGGNWWQEVVSSSSDFCRQVGYLVEELCNRLRQRFDEVGYVSIKARPQHSIPKYHLIFASRHPDAIEIMNDAMAKSRGQSSFFVDLFSGAELENLILSLASSPIARKRLIIDVIRNAFCLFSRSEIRGCIGDLLKDGRLQSSTGKKRINDNVKVWRSEDYLPLNG